MYQCVLFDMDGTIVNSYEGIFHAYQWSLEKIGEKFGGDSFVQEAIGAPLVWVFENLCGLSPAKTQQAVAYYREYYARYGKREAHVYKGIEQSLNKLREAGCYLGTATLKKENFAKEMLEGLGILSYFDTVCGMDKDDRFTKADLIRRCMQYAGVPAEKTILVGDSEFDAAGAREAGVDFLAVTYGFGFHDKKALEKWDVTKSADRADEIAERICSRKEGMEQ